MLSRFITLGFALAAFGLSACNHEETGTSGPRAGGSGSARIALPVVPQGYLAKTAAGTAAAFDLTVSGEGMAPIHQTWPLSPDRRDSVLVTGIPVGLRVFSGRLIQFDSARGDTVATHEGVDSAYIWRDSIAQVHLYLRRAGGGSAHVCVEVEGWPSDSSCIHPPIPPIPPAYRYYGGCWSVSVTKPGRTRKDDSIFKAKLRIDQWDSSLAAILTWNSGAKDTAYGWVRQDGTALIGFSGGGFNLKATVDSSYDSSNILRGYLIDSLRNIHGGLEGYRTLCDTVVEPPVSDTLMNCYAVTQALAKGKSSAGRLSVIAIDGLYHGVFHWNGFPSMYAYGDSLAGMLLDSAAIHLLGTAPKGMVPSPNPIADTLQYGISLRPAGTAFGTVQRLYPKGWAPAGTWTATPSGCGDKDFLP